MILCGTGRCHKMGQHFNFKMSSSSSSPIFCRSLSTSLWFSYPKETPSLTTFVGCFLAGFVDLQSRFQITNRFQILSRFQIWNRFQIYNIVIYSLSMMFLGDTVWFSPNAILFSNSPIPRSSIPATIWLWLTIWKDPPIFKNGKPSISIRAIEKPWLC